MARRLSAHVQRERARIGAEIEELARVAFDSYYQQRYRFYPASGEHPPVWEGVSEQERECWRAALAGVLMRQRFGS